MDTRHQKTFTASNGFTIVELLIVIVIIGILTAITIIAYNGIQTRAHAANAQADAENLAKLLANANTIGGNFPDDLSTINNGNPLSTVDGTTYAYHPGSGNTTYCATVTNSTSSYKISDASMTPQVGGCPGDGVGGVAAITNLVVNPSFELNVSGVVRYNSALFAQSTTGCYVGTACLSVDTSAGANKGVIYQSPTTQPTGVYYLFSAYVKGPAGQQVTISGRPTDTSNAYLGEGGGSQTYTLTSSWQRIVSQPYLENASGTRPGFQIIAPISNASPFYVDGMMMTQGSTVYNYADGNSTNWIWNGTAGNATSTGPPQ